MPHEPVLDIFQMKPNDGSIQAGGPLYRCVVDGCTQWVVIVKDEHGRERPMHLRGTLPKRAV